MNKFGTLFSVQIFGESHGACVGITIDGCPAGLPLMVADFTEDMERRKGGKQKGTTPRQEDDIPIFKTGIFNDLTTIGISSLILLFVVVPIFALEQELKEKIKPVS